MLIKNQTESHRLLIQEQNGWIYALLNEARQPVAFKARTYKELYGKIKQNNWTIEEIK